MIKRIMYLVTFGICTGCPVYDPPEEVLTFHNYSNEAIYISYGCEDELNCNRRLFLFEVLGGNILNEYGKPKKDTIAPNYRINAYAYGDIPGFGIGEQEVSCPNKVLKIFVIKESTLSENQWETICSEKQYEKFEYTEDQLDSLNWQVPYSYN